MKHTEGNEFPGGSAWYLVLLKKPCSFLCHNRVLFQTNAEQRQKELFLWKSALSSISCVKFLQSSFVNEILNGRHRRISKTYDFRDATHFIFWSILLINIRFWDHIPLFCTYDVYCIYVKLFHVCNNMLFILHFDVTFCLSVQWSVSRSNIWLLCAIDNA